MSAKIILTVMSGTLKGQKFQFSDRTTCIIGRAKDCSLQLPNDQYHKSISRYHCLLDINPPQLRVRDFGSLHGTYVNGEIIGKRQSHQTPEEAIQVEFPEYDLKDGDQIRLANTLFRVTIESINIEEKISSECTTVLIDQLKDFVPSTFAGGEDLPTFPGYVTLKMLGQGGFGEVYLARQDNTEKLIALKVMRPQIATSDRAKELFFREVENTKVLQHPHIVELQNTGYYDDVFFFTLEYCDGGSMANLIKQSGGKLSIDQAIPLIFQVLEGLEYAHQAQIQVKLSDGTMGNAHGLVHRDLKPANILLTNIGEYQMAKIADFGLSKAFDLAGLSGLSRSGTIAGTPAFMPRQQVLNFKYAKPEVDVWATAACLYYMLTGCLPRDGSAHKDPWLVVLQTQAIPISDRVRSIPKPLAQVIDQALIDHPNLYFKSAIAFKQALESVL